MAKLKFNDRLRQDKNFAREVDVLQRELVFLAMGVDAEEVAAAWDGTKFKRKAKDFVGATNRMVAEVRPVEFEDTGESPVQDLDTSAARNSIDQAAAAGNVKFLRAVQDYDTRVGISAAAHRALFDLRADAGDEEEESAAPAATAQPTSTAPRMGAPMSKRVK